MYTPNEYYMITTVARCTGFSASCMSSQSFLHLLGLGLLLLLLDLILPQHGPVGPGLVDAEQRAFLVGVPARRQRAVGDAQRRRAEGDEDGQQRHPRRHHHPLAALERVVHVEQRDARRHGKAHRERDPAQDAVEHGLRKLVVVVVVDLAVSAAAAAAGAAFLLRFFHHQELLLPVLQVLLPPPLLLLLLPGGLLGRRRRVAAGAEAAVRGRRADGDRGASSFGEWRESGCGGGKSPWVGWFCGRGSRLVE